MKKQIIPIITITLFSSCITRPVVLTYKTDSANKKHADSVANRRDMENDTTLLTTNSIGNVPDNRISLKGTINDLPIVKDKICVEDNETSQKTFQPSTINIEYDTIPIESLLDSLNDIQQQVLRKLDTINRNNEKIKYLDSIGAFDTSGKYVKWFEGENIEATNSQDTIPKIIIYIDTTYHKTLGNGIFWMNGYAIMHEFGDGQWVGGHPELSWDSKRPIDYLDENKQKLPKNYIVLMTK